MPPVQAWQDPDCGSMLTHKVLLQITFVVWRTALDNPHYKVSSMGLPRTDGPSSADRHERPLTETRQKIKVPRSPRSVQYTKMHEFLTYI